MSAQVLWGWPVVGGGGVGGKGDGVEGAVVTDTAHGTTEIMGSEPEPTYIFSVLNAKSL